VERELFARLVRLQGPGLPYPEPAQEFKQILVLALHVGWRRLGWRLGQQGHALSALDERQTTTLLVEELRRLLDSGEVDGFCLPFFAVERDAKVVNFDGLHPEKMPDIVFGLCNRMPGVPADAALHVECKPVGLDIGYKPYLDRDGLGCFLHGDYGSKARAGMMVAYGDTGYTFADVVTRLEPSFGQPGDPYATVQMPAIVVYSGIPAVTAIYESSHRRNWAYADGSRPGDIRITHVWLERLGVVSLPPPVRPEARVEATDPPAVHVIVSGS